MPFSVEDFQDLLRLLEQRPTWRAELRRFVLADELLELPVLVRRLAEAQERTEQRLQALAEAQARTDGRLEHVETALERLAQAQVRTEERLDRLEATVERLAQAQVRTGERLDRLEATLERLAQAQVRTGERLDRLAATVERLAQAQERTQEQLTALTQRVDGLAGDLAALAHRFDQHEQRQALDLQALKDGQLLDRLAVNPRFLLPLLAQPRVLDSAEIVALVDDLQDRGQLQRAEAQDIAQVDLLVQGQREGEQGYLVVEVSWTVGHRDIDRARRRAELLHRAGVRTWPTVVGYRASEEAAPRLERGEVLSLLLPE
ncbi:MAG: hypothetical protein HY690_15845 [Chloroflexi bacterium]|nr:hypothetical protein [Chloroflexota bacterium]